MALDLTNARKSFSDWAGGGQPKNSPSPAWLDDSQGFAAIGQKLMAAFS